MFKSIKLHYCILFFCCISTCNITAQDPLPLNWQNIFTKNTGARQAVLSPDGNMVAITARTTTQGGIFLKKVGSNEPPQFWIAGGSPSWFADGSKIVFSSRGDLWTIAVGETTPKRLTKGRSCLLYTSPSPRDQRGSRMPSSA